MKQVDVKVDITLIPMIGAAQLKIGPLVEFVQSGPDYSERLEKKKTELIQLYKRIKNIN